MIVSTNLHSRKHLWVIALGMIMMVIKNMRIKCKTPDTHCTASWYRPPPNRLSPPRPRRRWGEIAWSWLAPSSQSLDPFILSLTHCWPNDVQMVWGERGYWTGVGGSQSVFRFRYFPTFYPWYVQVLPDSSKTGDRPSLPPTRGKSIRPSLVLLPLVTSDVATWGLTEVIGDVKTKGNGAHHIFVTILQSMWTFTIGLYLKCQTTLFNVMTFVICQLKFQLKRLHF